MEDTNQRKPPVNKYNPPIRPISDLLLEDQQSSKSYRWVADEDEDIVIFSGDFSMTRGPLTSWADARKDFDERLLRNIALSQYVHPRKIQSHTIPLIMGGYDLKAQAETGSGKTAAFLLPIIQKALKAERPKGVLPRPSPFAIIVEPTRELCLQVYDQGRKLADGLNLKLCKAYGKYSIQHNGREMATGCDILFTTPGRLRHFITEINCYQISLDRLKIFVLDEADHILMEPHWIDDLRKILTFPGFPDKANRHTLLFSATFPQEVESLAEEVLKSGSVFVSNSKLIAANSRIHQNFIAVAMADKREALVELLTGELNGTQGQMKRILIFVHSKRDADIIAIFLVENGIKATSINGDRHQSLREKAINDFRNGRVNVLVATDLCARGIDIKGLHHVINYDVPSNLISYVHRIGRTGRIEKGHATSFIDQYGEADISLAPQLVKLLKEADKAVPEFLAILAGESDLPGLEKKNFIEHRDNNRAENDFGEKVAIRQTSGWGRAFGCESRSPIVQFVSVDSDNSPNQDLPRPENRHDFVWNMDSLSATTPFAVGADSGVPEVFKQKSSKPASPTRNDAWNDLDM